MSPDSASIGAVVLLSVLTTCVAPAIAQAPTRLEPRTRIDTVLAPGGVHQYELRLRAGHSIEVTVTQRGVDVVVEIRNERDSVVLRVDSPNGRNGPEVVELTAAGTARYRLLVRPLDEREPRGPYTLEVTAWRDATATRALLAARQRARAAAAAWLLPRTTPLPRLAGAPQDDTLAPLDSLAARAVVIAVGEATHGSREFGDLRLRLTRYLVEHQGFRLVAIEASASRLAVLDRYVRGAGTSDSIRGVVETGWIGRRSLRELVAWLRAWNRLHAGEAVGLVGLDAQENELARRDLREFFERAYPQAAERYAAVEREIAAADSQATVFGDSRVDTTARGFLREALAHIESDAPALARIMDTALVRRGRQAARILLQFAEFNAGDSDGWSRSRDWYMAVNLLGALGSMPQAKTVLWAHNAHVAAPTDRSGAGQPMGAWLRAALGCRYGALAVTFGAGAFVAQIPNDLEDDLAISTLPTAPVESVEGVLRTLHPAGTLATWPCRTAGDVPDWLREPRLMHWVGALFRPGTDPTETFRPVRLVNDFDGIVFIPAVTADEVPTDRPLVPARRR